MMDAVHAFKYLSRTKVSFRKKAHRLVFAVYHAHKYRSDQTLIKVSEIKRINQMVLALILIRLSWMMKVRIITFLSDPRQYTVLKSTLELFV